MLLSAAVSLFLFYAEIARFVSNSLRKNLEIGALAVFLPRVLGRSGCCEQTLTYAVSSLGMRVRL